MSSLSTGTVTFLFTDIEGSPRIWERSPEAMSVALARHDGILRRLTEEHGGRVFKTVGDAFCCAFATAPHAFGERRTMALYEAFVYDLDGQEAGSRTGVAPV